MVEAELSWVAWKGLAVRGVGMVALAALAGLFVRSLWLRTDGDEAFSLAFTAFILGVLWALGIVTVGALDEAFNWLQCADLRRLSLTHPEVVWGPLLLAAYWLLWVVARRRP